MEECISKSDMGYDQKLEMDDSQGNNLEVVSELQKFVEYQQGDFEKNRRENPEKKQQKFS